MQLHSMQGVLQFNKTDSGFRYNVGWQRYFIQQYFIFTNQRRTSWQMVHHPQ
jgi:hypothetical protein